MLSKSSSNKLTLAAVLWWPVTLLFITPGWGTFFLFSPYFVLIFAPLLMFTFNRPYQGKRLPKVISWLQVAFFVNWFASGFFFVNGGDTEESVGSMFTRLFGSELASISNSLMLFTLGTSLVLILVLATRIGLESDKPGQ